MTKNSISVTIPNFNGVELLKKNLPLLYIALNKHVEDYEIIIADDASSDHSIQFIRNNYPEVILIKHTKNQGFSKNINSAIRMATKNLVLLLNTDVELTEDYFKPLFKYFERSDTFGVMGKVIGIQEGEIQDAAKYPTIGKTSLRTNINYKSGKEIGHGLSTLFLSGGWSLVDRKKLQELNGFDEVFSPFYGEDVDLSLRAWKVGYRCYFEPKAVCKHPSSATIGKIKKSRIKLAAKRNKMMLQAIHLDRMNLILYLTILSLKVPFRALILDFNYVKAYSQLLLRLNQAFRSRREIRRKQSLKGISISMADIKEKILEGVNGLEIQKF